MALTYGSFTFLLEFEANSIVGHEVTQRHHLGIDFHQPKWHSSLSVVLEIKVRSSKALMESGSGFSPP